MNKLIRNNNFVLREIAGDSFLIPVGDASVQFNGMITLNTTSAFIWKSLENAKTEDELVAEILEVYESSEKQVRMDVKDFLSQLKSIQMIKEL